MRSLAEPEFWVGYQALPTDVRLRADKQYALFRRDPNHPSLQFKQIRPGLWSARITGSYRTLAHRDGDTVAWFWIGTHAEYDRLLK